MGGGEESPEEEAAGIPSLKPSVERKLLELFLNPTLEFPLPAATLCSKIKDTTDQLVVAETLRKLASQDLLELHATEPLVLSVNIDRLSALAEGVGVAGKEEPGGPPGSKRHRSLTEEIEWLLSTPSVRETENKKMGAEILELLNTKSVMEQLMVEKFQSAGGSQLREFCSHKTKEQCRRERGSSKACGKLHFRRIIQIHTDESLGDCSFLNTCFHMETCKFVHYEIDNTTDEPKPVPRPLKTGKSTAPLSLQPRTKLVPPQWVNCDLRYFDVSVLGKFSVIMADPPWDIHMELPYGTMQDDEMRTMNISVLQDEGYLFLWITGRAMELARDCLTLWGYERVDELVWVKTNQLQRLIRTGRTGHWINHGKEHCLVGMKGNPPTNRCIDCDVIVAEVRETSHKPDELYGVIERLTPGTRKIELFGRAHNCQPNWMTLGNQLDGIHIIEPDIAASFWAKYPNGELDTMRPRPNFGPGPVRGVGQPPL